MNANQFYTVIKKKKQIIIRKTKIKQTKKLNIKNPTKIKNRKSNQKSSSFASNFIQPNQ